MGFIVDVKDNCKLSAEEPLRGQDVLAVCGKKGIQHRSMEGEQLLDPWTGL